MKDMKRSMSERKGTDSAICCTGEEYPWGLQISLEKAELEKLGVDSVNVGDEIVFTAKAKVVSMSESASDGEEERKNMSLQIVEMDIPQPSKERSERMYSDSGEG